MYRWTQCTLLIDALICVLHGSLHLYSLPCSFLTVQCPGSFARTGVLCRSTYVPLVLVVESTAVPVPVPVTGTGTAVPVPVPGPVPVPVGPACTVPSTNYSCTTGTEPVPGAGSTVDQRGPHRLQQACRDRTIGLCYSVLASTAVGYAGQTLNILRSGRAATQNWPLSKPVPACRFAPRARARSHYDDEQGAHWVACWSS